MLPPLFVGASLSFYFLIDGEQTAVHRIDVSSEGSIRGEKHVEDSKPQTNPDRPGSQLGTPSKGLLAIKNAIRDGDLTLAWKNISGFEAGELADVWKLLEEADTGHAFFDELYALVGARASALGETEQLLQLVAKIGQGRTRSRVIEYAFHASKLSPEQMSALFAGLGEKDRTAALSGWARQIGSVPTWSELAAFDWTSQPAVVQEALLKGLASRPYLQHQGDPKARANEIRSVYEFLGQLSAKEGAIKSLLDDGVVSLIKELPLEAYQILTAEGYFNTNPPDSVVSQLLRSTSLINPKEALDLLNQFSDIPLKAVENTFSRALATDSRSAETWFETNKGSLSPEIVDGIISARVTNDIREGDFRGAWKLIDEISSPELKLTIEEQVWMKERAVVRESASKNPREFLENIRLGESDHAEYWIREGFLLWFNQDPDIANGWYSNNRSHLTPSQSQHIARAYAEVALEQGDVALAREWSARVVDPEFKQKLLNQIEARAQAGSE
jgi:hypothetical protein